MFPGVEDGLLNPTLCCLPACILRLCRRGKKVLLSRKSGALPGSRMQLLAYEKLGRLDFEDLAGRFLVREWSCLIQCYLTDELVYCDCADLGSCIALEYWVTPGLKIELHASRRCAR